jgi:predicted nucleotidyltransferase
MIFPEDDGQVLSDLSALGVRLGTNALLIGAGARLCVFDRLYGVSGRATKDLDFAVQSTEWADFERFIEAMTEGNPALFSRTRIGHRFQHLATGKMIDVIPFGPIALPDRIINWQDGNQMSVLGLDEAWDSAETIDPAISVVSLPALVGLKLITWLERIEPKDLDDVVLILQRLLDNSEAIEMVYVAIGDLLISGEVEFEVAGAVYLGAKIRQIFFHRTTVQIITAIDRIIQHNERYLPQFVNSYLRGADWDAEFDLLLERFRALRWGIDESNLIDDRR